LPIRRVSGERARFKFRRLSTQSLNLDAITAIRRYLERTRAHLAQFRKMRDMRTFGGRHEPQNQTGGA